ncbi:AAA domain-containing protein [Aspergillus ambiguus]|uniref:AAA domain-containing protein n=1 Tax=Aspergillus ambiguus TaxID=176160 RepID=UPI003CCCC135
MAGSDATINPEAPEFVCHGGKSGCMEVPEENVSVEDAEQGDNGQSFDGSRASSEDCKPTVNEDKLDDFWTHVGDSSFPNFVFKTHFPIKQSEGDDETTNVEYEDPCYIDIEFTTTGGVSHGLLAPCVGGFDEQCQKLFAHLYSLTRHCSEGFRTVKFRVDVAPEHVDHTDGLTDALQELANSLPQSRSYHPYRSHGQDIRIMYGQQKPRALVQQAWGSDMVKFRAVSYFEDVDAYLVKMAYGAVLEWRRPYEQIRRIQEIPSMVTLRKLGPSIVASVCLDRDFLKDDIVPYEMRGSEVILPEYTDVKLTIRIPQKSGPPSEWNASGFTVTGYHEDASPEDIHIVLYGDRFGKLLKDADTTVTHPGMIKFDINEAPVKRQINALVKLHSKENGVGRWLDLLLNQEYNALPNVDLLQGIDDKVINSALGHLLSLKNWNAQQRAAFRSLRMTKGGCSILEGFPGCGKTSILAATAIFLYYCGFNILLTGASNAAVDALVDELTALDPISYVRIRRGEVEKRARKSANPQEPGAVEEANSELEKHIALIGLLQTLKSSLSRKAEGNPEYSLLAHVKRKCIDAVAKDEQYPVNVAQGAQKSETEIPDYEADPKTHDIRNAYKVVEEYLSQPKTPRPGPSASEEENNKWLIEESAFKKCYDSVVELVVQEASIIACTNNLAGTPVVRRNFGANGKEILVIADEDGQALEPDVIIPLVSLDRSDLVIGTIRGGDRQQLPPLAITASEVPGYNEFGYQMGRSFFDRLRRARFPVTVVSQQHRMHPRLSKFPSEFTYSGKMSNDPSVGSICISAEFSNALLDWIKTKAPGAKFEKGIELVGVNVTDGQTLRNDKNYSRSNPANVLVVTSLVEFLISRGALEAVTCVIITTYSEQKKEYVDKMMMLSEKHDIAWEEMVRVATVDSMQGHEADVVILDWVIDSGTKSDLGFASDNRRANVALTRARSCLIVVANGSIIDNDRLSAAKPREMHPEILVHWRYLLDNDLIVDSPAGLMTSDTDNSNDPDNASNTVDFPENSDTWGGSNDGEDAVVDVSISRQAGTSHEFIELAGLGSLGTRSATNLGTNTKPDHHPLPSALIPAMMGSMKNWLRRLHGSSPPSSPDGGDRDNPLSGPQQTTAGSHAEENMTPSAQNEGR